MAEYIDREKLVAELEEEIEYESGMFTREQNYYLEKGLRIALKDVKHMPTEDVVPIKYGEWLPDYETFTDCNGYESEPIQTGWMCSVCDRQESRKEPYCHCGALMSNYEDEKKGEDNAGV